MFSNQILFTLFQDPWPAQCDLLNLWHAKIFPPFQKPEDALRHGAAMLNASRSDGEFNSQNGGDLYYSMADILRLKDISGFLKMRTDLRMVLEK